MSDYDNQKGGERPPLPRTAQIYAQTVYIFQMAQFQGGKIYEAPRCSLNYFAL